MTHTARSVHYFKIFFNENFLGIINNALDHQSINWQKLYIRFVSQAGGIRVSDPDR
jgi:hypothetical protein